MFDFLSSVNVFTILITLIFIAISVFTTYETLKRYHNYRKKIVEFQNSHPHVQMTDYSKTPFLGMVALGIIILCLCIFTWISGLETMYIVVYLCLGILFLALAVDNIMRYQCAFIKDGFYYQDGYIRFKSLREVRLKDGLFKKGYLVLTGSEEIQCSYKIAQAIQKQQILWKKQKKRK